MSQRMTSSFAKGVDWHRAISVNENSISLEVLNRLSYTYVVMTMDQARSIPADTLAAFQMRTLHTVILIASYSKFHTSGHENAQVQVSAARHGLS